MRRARDSLRNRLGLAPLRRPVPFGSATTPPLPGPRSMTSPQMLQRAFGADRAARLEADATVLGEAFPAPDVPALAAALLPDNWGSVREVFGVLKKQGEGGLAAVPTLAAWLLVAPTRVGKAQGYLTGWEAYALAEAWYTLGALNKELRRAVDHAGEGRVGAALAGLVELCDGAMVEEAAGVLAGPDGNAQRGAVDFLGTAVGAAERARSALLRFARTPAPDGEAGLGYARGEAIRAWSGLERFVPVAPAAGTAGVPLPSAPPPPDSWAGRLAAFRALLTQPDLREAREVARELLLAGPPPTPAGMELRAAVVDLLTRPTPAPGWPGSAGAEGARLAHRGRADDDPAADDPADDDPADDDPADDDPADDDPAGDNGAGDLLALGPRTGRPEGASPRATAAPAPPAPPSTPSKRASPAASRALTHLCALAAPGQPAEVRVSALESLARRFPTDEEVLDLLCLAAEDDDATLRLAAARLLGEL